VTGKGLSGARVRSRRSPLADPGVSECRTAGHHEWWSSRRDRLQSSQALAVIKLERAADPWPASTAASGRRDDERTAMIFVLVLGTVGAVE